MLGFHGAAVTWCPLCRLEGTVSSKVLRRGGHVASHDDYFVLY